MSTLVLDRPRAPRPTLAVGGGVSPTWETIRIGIQRAHRHMARPVSRQSVRQVFEELADTWRTETAFQSSVSDITTHPAYRAIVEMGHNAVPLILRSLDQSPDHWFVALSAITGANPTSSEDRGNVPITI